MEKLLSDSSFSASSHSISLCSRPGICYPGREGKSLDDFVAAQWDSCSGNICWSLLSQKFSHGALVLCDTQLFRQLFGWTMYLFVLWGTGTVSRLDMAITGGIFPHKPSFTENHLQQNNVKEVGTAALSVAWMQRGILMPSEGDWLDVPKALHFTCVRHCPDYTVGITLYLQKKRWSYKKCEQKGYFDVFSQHISEGTWICLC